MGELEYLAKEIALLREELEGIKQIIDSRSFLPVFYKRAIVIVLICSIVGVVIAAYNTYQSDRLYSLIRDWSLYEVSDTGE